MAHYLDDTQRHTLARQAASWTWRTQWPTWALIVAIYGGWFGVALHARALGLPLATALLAALSAWYMSLQHELLHGHPTRWPLFNALLGAAPLAVWFPYRVYRESHLRHHDDAHLTEPRRDPESYFVSEADWQRAGVAIRALLTLRNTFVGRLLVGPAFSIAATAVDALARIRRGDWRDVPAWLAHLAALLALTSWLQHGCGVPAWLFFTGVGYGALSLSSIRSFQEHRMQSAHAHRTVINEAGWCWRLLFLNNNYHAVHHDLPHVPWFAIRRVYVTSRAQYVERSGNFLVSGYGEWLRRYAFTSVASPVHGERHGTGHSEPRGPGGFAGQSRMKFANAVRRGEAGAVDLLPTDRQSARQVL